LAPGAGDTIKLWLSEWQAEESIRIELCFIGFCISSLRLRLERVRAVDLIQESEDLIFVAYPEINSKIISLYLSNKILKIILN
jgi:hypothetical protein